jgi:hypothetical protein
MATWDYEQQEFIELRYEELVADEAIWFARIFRHYGFDARAVEMAVEIAEANSFSRTSNRALGEERRGSHLRSGRPGEWREHFGPSHRELFDELAGEAVVRLGYPATDHA